MTNHNLAPLPTPTSIDDLEGIDDEMREALERMQALYTATESRSDHFQSLYAKGET